MESLNLIELFNLVGYIGIGISLAVIGVILELSFTTLILSIVGLSTYIGLESINPILISCFISFNLYEILIENIQNETNIDFKINWLSIQLSSFEKVKQEIECNILAILLALITCFSLNWIQLLLLRTISISVLSPFLFILFLFYLSRKGLSLYNSLPIILVWVFFLLSSFLNIDSPALIPLSSFYFIPSQLKQFTK